MRPRRRRLGVDIGRVIISAAGSDDEDTSFLRATGDAVLKTPPSEGMFEVLPGLVRHFDGEVWLVSKAREGMQSKTNRWLAHHRCFERTGVPPSNLRYCLERSEKARQCADLRITDFIDDRIDVITSLEGIVARRYLFGPQEPDVVLPRGVTWLKTWHDARISAFQ